MTNEIVVLRYGHRTVRDYRVSSHCCLVARAFGAKKIEIIGDKDESIKTTLNSVNSRWGKGATVAFFDSWRKRVTFYKKKGYIIIQLTMYGLAAQDVEKEIRKHKKLLVIIGSQKVERGVYENSDYNVSVTLQPHSEIAALAVFLDRIQEGKELVNEYPGAKIEVKPINKGKCVLKKE